MSAGSGVTLIPELAVPRQIRADESIRYIPFDAVGSDQPENAWPMLARNVDGRTVAAGRHGLANAVGAEPRS